METDHGIIISSCRICRESTSSHKVTFEFDSEWSKLYELCFGVQVTQYGPQTFCKSCSDKLSDYGNFKRLCLQSEEIWKSLSADVTLEVPNFKLNVLKEENIEFLDEFDYMQHDGYDSDGHLLIIKEEDEKINDFVKNLKDKLGEICIDKIEKPVDENLQLSTLDTKCRKIKINSKKETKCSKYLDKKGNLTKTKKGYLQKNSNKCGVITKQEATEFFCGICNYSSTSQTEADQHFVQHCQDNVLNCKLCSFEGKDIADMVVHRYTHIKTDKIIKYKCHLCPKKFMVDKKFTFHYRKMHLKQEGAALCQFCGKAFMNYKKWIMHERLHVSANFECDHCGSRFLDRNKIIDHLVNMHSDVRNFTCDYCGRGFKVLRNLKSHINNVHTESKKETCTTCNRTFKNSLGLQKHNYFHHNEKKYLCEICSMGFTCSPLLKMHMFYHHSDERPHACDLCDARYRSKQQLKVHKRKHSGELPYTCAECGKGFSDYAACKRHQSVHTGVRRVKCLYCDRTFHERKLMLAHCSSKHKDIVCKDEKIE